MSEECNVDLSVPSEVVGWRALGGMRIAGFLVMRDPPRSVEDARFKLERTRVKLNALLEADDTPGIPVDLPDEYMCTVALGVAYIRKVVSRFPH